MTYNKKDSYTETECVTIDTLNAVEEQMRLRYAQNVKYTTGEDLPMEGTAFWKSQASPYLRGMKDALADLTHVNGTIVAHIAMADIKRVRDAG